MPDWLKQRVTKVERRPDVIVVHGVEGVGKSALAAQFSEATFMMSENETGIITLIQNGLVPECSYFPQFKSWTDVIGCTKELRDTEKPPRTLVVDTLNGIESLLHAHICKEKYEDKMDKKGFLAFNEGPKASVPEWRQWLSMLDAIRAKGTTVLLLSHTMVGKVKNPEGTDYDKYTPQMHPETWSATHKFADMIVFMTFFVQVLDADKKSQNAVGGTQRLYHFENTATIVAKNRHGTQPTMRGTGSASGDFKAFVQHVKAGLKAKAPEKASA